MRLERLSEENRKYYEKAIELYKSAFPREERREEDEQRRVLKKEDYHFDFIFDGEEMIGIMLYWETDRFIYLEHFVTRNDLRNRGYGKKALDLIKEKSKKVILEIEDPVDDISKRRKDFYDRNGFYLNEHFHIQPKYHLDDEDMELKIMSTSRALTKEEYDDFYSYVLKEAAIQKEQEEA